MLRAPWFEQENPCRATSSSSPQTSGAATASRRWATSSRHPTSMRSRRTAYCSPTTSRTPRPAGRRGRASTPACASIGMASRPTACHSPPATRTGRWRPASSGSRRRFSATRTPRPRAPIPKTRRGTSPTASSRGWTRSSATANPSGDPRPGPRGWKERATPFRTSRWNCTRRPSRQTVTDHRRRFASRPSCTTPGSWSTRSSSTSRRAPAGACTCPSFGRTRHGSRPRPTTRCIRRTSSHHSNGPPISKPRVKRIRGWPSC